MEAFVRQVEAADSIEQVWALAVSSAASVGFDGLCYHHTPPFAVLPDTATTVFSHVIDPALMEAYTASLADALDPIRHMTSQRAVPFTLASLRDEAALIGEQKRMVSELEEAVGEALIVPAFGPCAQLGFFCLVGDQADSVPLTERRLIQSLGQVVHLRFCELAPPAPMVPLTARELNVVRWAAVGRSNGEIGELLGITRHTVDAHLRRIYGKLGVNDRVTAAIKATTLGLVAVGSPVVSGGEARRSRNHVGPVAR